MICFKHLVAVDKLALSPTKSELTDLKFELSV